MRFRITIIVVACAFAVPLILLGLIEMWNGSFPTSLADIYTLAINWLYMSASHLMAVLISIAFRPARRYFLPWSLIALSVALTAFWCWIMWWVPPSREWTRIGSIHPALSYRSGFGCLYCILVAAI
jgi:hypothetical protein